MESWNFVVKESISIILAYIADVSVLTNPVLYANIVFNISKTPSSSFISSILWQKSKEDFKDLLVNVDLILSIQQNFVRLKRGFHRPRARATDILAYIIRRRQIKLKTKLYIELYRITRLR